MEPHYTVPERGSGIIFYHPRPGKREGGGVEKYAPPDIERHSTTSAVITNLAIPQNSAFTPNSQLSGT